MHLYTFGDFAAASLDRSLALLVEEESETFVRQPAESIGWHESEYTW